MVCAGIAQWKKNPLPAENNVHICGRWGKSWPEPGRKRGEDAAGYFGSGDTADSSACMGLETPIPEAFAWSLSGGGCELSNLRFREGSAGTLFRGQAKDDMAWEDVEPLKRPSVRKNETSLGVKSRAGRAVVPAG
jgi:hypothetical protein